MFKTLIACLALAALTACSKQAVSTEQSNNPEIQVDTLFIKDGCTVYRFRDGGYARYFTKCGGHTQTNWQESCGKNCTLPVEITTKEN